MNNELICPYCANTKFWNNGHNPNGSARKRCSNCKRQYPSEKKLSLVHNVPSVNSSSSTDTVPPDLNDSPEINSADPLKINYHFKQENGKAEISADTNIQIKTLDQLIKICEIDTELWEIYKWECTAWGVTSKWRDQNLKWINGVMNGHAERHNSFLHSPLFHIKAFLKPNKPLILLKSFKDEILEDIKTYAFQYPEIIFPENKFKRLFEVDCPDLHYGKQSWGQETGEDNDIQLTERKFNNFISCSVSNARYFNVEKILFPIGNDFFNTNSKENTTTHGTPQDEDQRWKKTFRLGRMMVIRAIDSLSTVAPVEVLIIPGNHDEEKIFYLGEVLESWYRNSRVVKVDNSPKDRKFYPYGKCLIAFDHGQDIKPEELPLLLAVEEPILWGNSTFREWHTGHKHTEKATQYMEMFEKKGVKVRFLSSLTPPDFYHYRHGYIGNIQQGHNFIWDHNLGNIAQLMGVI